MSDTEDYLLYSEAPSTKVLQSFIEGLTRMTVWAVVGAIIGIPLNTVPAINEWCTAHVYVGVLMAVIATNVINFHPTNVFLKACMAILFTSPPVILSSSAGFASIFAWLFPQTLMIGTYNIIQFRSKKSGYSVLVPVSLFSVLCYCLITAIVPDSFLWTATFSIGSLILAHIAILFTIPLQDLNLSLVPALQSEAEIIKQQWKSHFYSMITLHILSVFAVSTILRLNAAVHDWCISNVWEISLIVSFIVGQMGKWKQEGLQYFVKICFMIGEAFMIGIPFSSITWDRYILLIFAILISYFAALFTEDILTFSAQIALLWSCFGVGFYCTYYDNDKLYYSLIFVLYIFSRLMDVFRSKAEQRKKEIQSI